jgi:UDP-glucose 4-epimerase
MKIIIIGSKGFIGQHLFDYYLKKSYIVYGADVVVDYVNTENYFLIDSTNSDFHDVFQSRTFDLCVNCSGAASVPASMENPLRDYLLNTVNVFKILQAIKACQPECKFINLSSAAVYGNPIHLPVKETSRLNPISPYGIHKLYSEQICKEFNDLWKIKTCSLRIFSVYGVGLRKQLYWDLFMKSIKDTSFNLHGTGKESRDYINVNDLVRAIELCSLNSHFDADIINVANGEEVMIFDTVKMFLELFDTEMPFSFSGSVRKGDPINWKADISRLNSFGYKPSVDLRTGLEEYLKWVRNENIG